MGKCLVLIMDTHPLYGAKSTWDRFDLRVDIPLDSPLAKCWIVSFLKSVRVAESARGPRTAQIPRGVTSLLCFLPFCLTCSMISGDHLMKSIYVHEQIPRHD